MPAFSLVGHNAIVTGGATGIGATIGRRLAAAGAKVALADIDVESANQSALSIGAQALAVPMDVTNAESVRRAIQTVVDRWSTVHILVNNAGIAGKAAPVWEQNE